MSFLEQFPDRATLLESYQPDYSQPPLKVNNHIHTPYSFSAFRSIEEAVKMAKDEDVKVLGINDFYVTDGFGEFIEKCRQHQLFPLLNIELIGISREDREAGVRVNDPNNPGRTYISGKGLAFPSILSGEQQQKLDGVVKESNNQVVKMIDLVNRWLEFQQAGISLSVEEIMKEHAMQLLRERHVAKALRLKIEESAGSDEIFFGLLEKVYGGKSSEKRREDIAGLEEELRARLLKAGAPAFVPEDEKAFMNLEEIIGIIRDAGGIPTYPMLLDGAGGGITEFESDKGKLLEVLRERGFRSVELIPLRNRIEVLKEYAEYFYENGFVVSFGTEHNTTVMLPLTISCKNKVSLDKSLMQISFNGAAYLAAHQYLFQKEGPGYQQGDRNEMERLGRAVLNHYFTST
ncbi:MAG: PHP domain-containing protein [Bacteroidales bacterium]|nr:PHP domain-containing protein [Bacteroidales bacterium]